MSIPPTLFNFLEDLSANNNREWFNANKDRYVEQNEVMKAFTADVHDKLSHHDEIEASRVYRIYRDVRFSKNKTPYKEHFAANFKRASKWKRGGMYLHISNEDSFIAGGFWGPEKDDLKRLRDEFVQDGDRLRTIINAPAFIKTFGQLEGEQLKTKPKGYDKDHPNIDLLRYKQFLLYRKCTKKEVLSSNFSQLVSDTFKEMRPFFDYMSSVLTTDLNGVSID